MPDLENARTETHAMIDDECCTVTAALFVYIIQYFYVYIVWCFILLTVITGDDSDNASCFCYLCFVNLYYITLRKNAMFSILKDGCIVRKICTSTDVSIIRYLFGLSVGMSRSEPM